VEGAWNEDCKGASIRDTFVNTRKHVVNGKTGVVTADHSNRYKEDMDLMKDPGLDA